MKNKKGEITTQQVVLLIILIASFAVILFFIFRLNLGKTSDKEICHNSVLARGSQVVPGESIPLNCKTSYVCITEDNSCEKMSGNFEKKKVSSENEVYEVLANEMADCWWMFGEGELNYVNKELFSQMYCSLCSQIAFDDSMTEIFSDGEIDQKQLYDYLINTQIPEKEISYFEYLEGFKVTSEELGNYLSSSGSQFGKINFDKYYYVLTGVKSKSGVLLWTAGGAAVVGAALVVFSGGLGLIAIGGAVAGGFAGNFIGTTVISDSDSVFIPPTIIEANSEELNSLQCASIKTLA